MKKVILSYKENEGWLAEIKMPASEGSELQPMLHYNGGLLKAFKTVNDLKMKVFECYSSQGPFEILVKPKDTLHRKLVEIAYRWVLANCSVGVAFKEIKSLSGEIADVIAFGGSGHSILIEVKTSRSDFLSDKKKPHRKNPSEGMGTQRFYCCPEGLIKKEELPHGWGLIYVNAKGKARRVFSPYIGNIGERLHGLEKNKTAEMHVMYSCLRRLHLQGLIEEIYPKYE